MKKLALSSGKIHEFLLMNEKEAKELYHNKGFTARQVANHFNILFTPAFQKLCHTTLGTKNLGRGGSRFGAGNFSERKKPKRRKKANIFIFDFSDNIVDIIKENVQPNGEYYSHTKFIEECIFWYNQNKNNG